jgi:hypothetical protein
MVTFTCSTCNSYRNWSYEADLGKKYTRLTNQMGPFREISIDPLGPVVVKAFPGSRKHVKCYPLMIKCINSAAVQLILMESMETKQVVLSLLRLETRYGDIQAISRDSGTNLLEGNLNPKTEDENRLFNIIKDYTAPVDAQFRNYSERSTGLIKKYLKQACGIEKNDTIPVMLRSEIEFLLDMAASMVNRIPYAFSRDMVIISPADTLFMGPKWDFLPQTKSKLRSINDMVSNLKIHKKEMEKIRDEHLIHELENAKLKTKKQGRITGDIKPEVGDLVLIRNEGKTDYDRYGVIDSILTPQTIKIRTRTGMVTRPTSITIPISPKCLIGDGTLKVKKNE